MCRAINSTGQKHDNKQFSKKMTSPPMTCLLYSSYVFFVVFKKSHCKACISECIILNVIHGPDFLICCWSFCHCQHHAQVKQFTSCWRNPYETSNGETFLPRFPFSLFFVINKL